MPTYTAQVQTSAGAQSFQLAAANHEEAARMVEARAKEASEGDFRYTIAQQTPLKSPEAIAGLISASSGLLACILLLIVADFKLRQWLKN